MGAGVAAVAGIETEPSSCCTAIEEAQAELRQELAGRNERRRELEFLEKGGDPLEFKLIESSASLWSFSQADPFAKNFLSSNAKISYSLTNITEEDKVELICEDGSELKKARSSLGKFLVDHDATTINPIADNLTTNINCSLEHDRKKGLDLCKSNRPAVKGQYARRNRQRSNRFGDGRALLLDSGKPEVESGSSNYSPGIASILSNGKVQDSIKEGSAQATAHQDSFQSRDSTDIIYLRDVKGDFTIAIGDSAKIATEDSARDSQNAVNLDKNSKCIQITNNLPSLESTMKTVSELPLENERISSSLPCKTELLNSVSSVSIVTGREEDNKVCDDLTKKGESKLGIEILKEPSVPLVSQTIEYTGNLNEDDLVKGLYDKSNDLRKNENTFTIILASEATDNIAKVNPTDVNLDLIGDRSAATCPSQSENKIYTDGQPERVQEIEGVNIKVEEETSEGVGNLSKARLCDQTLMAVTMRSEVNSDCSQYPHIGNLGSGNAAVEDLQDSRNMLLPNKLQDGTMTPDKIEETALVDGRNDVKENCSAIKGGLTEEEVEMMKSSAHKSADLVKENVIQELRKKSHWDFVLEEMAWLANDFMQERLWKIAAAAQVARWIAKEKQLLEFEQAEIQKRQKRIAQSLAKRVATFWLLSEALPKDFVRHDKATLPVLSNSKSTETATHEVETKLISAEARVLSDKIRPVQKYAVRFLENSADCQAATHAEAPPTPDRVSESGLCEFWEEQFEEESLFYTVPNYSMESYCQSIVSQWEMDYEERLRDHESALMEAEVHAGGEENEYATGIYDAAPLVSPFITGKRSSGIHGVNRTNATNIPTKRMRTSAVAARQRAAGVAAPFLSGSAVHLARSDISSCETSQQDEISMIVEGSSISGKFTDVDSNGAFIRSQMVVDGVDSPLKSKKKKKARTSNGAHSASAAFDVRESEQSWQYRGNEQKEHIKHKGEHVATGSPGLEGFGTQRGMGTASNNSKLIKHMSNRDRGRKYKAGKASISQSGYGIPWSPIEDQAILGLVYELGANWELVSDILSSNSQLKGIFRKSKDCKERHRFLTERLGGEDDDSPADPSSSSRLPLSLAQKGGTRILPQHLEETLKNHIDCILQLHQQIRSKRAQNESQERKQLVPEHESHASKHAGFPAIALTPLELCDQVTESSSHPYSHQYAHGNGLGISNMLPSGSGMRPNSSAMSSLQIGNNLQLSSMAPSALNAAAARDALRTGASVRLFTAEEQRSRYNRLVVGRGMQTQGISTTAGLPPMSLPNSGDSDIPSGNNAGLGRGIPVPRNNLPGIGLIGEQHVAAGMNNVLPSMGTGLSGASSVSSSLNMMRRPRDAMSMALNSPNSSAVLSPIQSLSAQASQHQQHNTLQAQEYSPGSSQPQTSSVMHVAKECQQLQQQDLQMRMQLSSKNNTSSQCLFPSSETFPASHVLSHNNMFAQQSQLLIQPHASGQESGSQQRTVALKGMDRGSIQGQPTLLHSQLSAHTQIVEEQCIIQPQIASQNLAALSEAPDALGQQYQTYQQKGFQVSGKQISPQQSISLQSSSPAQAITASLSQQTPIMVDSLSSSQQQQQRRANQLSQTQHRRPQHGQASASTVTQSASTVTQSATKNVIQQRTIPSQLSGVQLSSNMSGPLGMASTLDTSIPLASTSSGGSGSISSSPQWKSGQSFSPMAGLYNLSRGNNGAPQALHLPISVGMQTPSNCSVGVSTASLVSQESRIGVQSPTIQHAIGHVGALSQKPLVNATQNRRSTPSSQLITPSKLPQQQISCLANSPGGSQVRPSSSGATPGPE